MSKKDKTKKSEKSATLFAAVEESSELAENQWAVISHDRVEVCHLTYDEAITKLENLADRKVSGLCIITDEAAARIFSPPA